MNVDTLRKAADLCKTAYVKSTYEINDISIYVEETYENIFIVFKGSDSCRTWLRNLNFLSTKKDDFYVHSGFLNAFEEIKDILGDLIESLIPFKKLIFFVGHSFGSTLATLAGTHFKFGNVITFGSPKVGCEKFVDRLEKVPNIHFQTGQDVVSMLPCWLRHPKHCVQLTKIRSCSFYIDHGINAYIEALSAFKFCD